MGETFSCGEKRGKALPCPVGMWGIRGSSPNFEMEQKRHSPEKDWCGKKGVREKLRETGSIEKLRFEKGEKVPLEAKPRR